MLIKMRKRKAQSITEYSILVTLVVAAAIAMQHEVRRGIQGRVHDSLTYLAQQTSDIGTTGQYEPQSGTKTSNQSASQTVNENFTSNDDDIYWEKDASASVSYTSNITR